MSEGMRILILSYMLSQLQWRWIVCLLKKKTKNKNERSILENLINDFDKFYPIWKQKKAFK